MTMTQQVIDAAFENAIQQVIDSSPECQANNITTIDIVEELITTQQSFCPDWGLEQIWEQEKPYFEKYGMTAFNAGYAGLTKKNKKQ